MGPPNFSGIRLANRNAKFMGTKTSKTALFSRASSNFLSLAVKMTCKELEHYFDELYICSIGFQLHISLVDFSDFTFIRKLYALVAEGTFDLLKITHNSFRISILLRKGSHWHSSLNIMRKGEV